MRWMKRSGTPRSLPVRHRDRPPRRAPGDRFAEGFAGVRPAGLDVDRVPDAGDAVRGSPRWRRMASRRFPAPRPSRAGCVELSVPRSEAGVEAGVGVGVEDCVGAGVVFASEGAGFESPDAACVPTVAGVVPVVPAAGASCASAERPPERIAAPIPILRRAVMRPHLGHFRSGSALIDWKRSHACRQEEHSYS